MPNAKCWFLTYPQCDLLPKTILAHLSTKGTVLEYVIASEDHS